MTENEETSDAPITNTPELKLQHRINLDYQKSRLTEYFLKNKTYSFRIVECPSNYYELSLDHRREILNAHSKDIICKSIILENTVFDSTIENELYQKYYLVVVQYVSKYNAVKIATTLKNYINQKHN